MVIGFCYISIVLCWVSFFSLFLLYFRSVCVVFSLCVLFFFMVGHFFSVLVFLVTWSPQY